MGGSNLPPGVTESMIPGNRPEDVIFEKELEDFNVWLEEYSAHTGLTLQEIKEVIIRHCGK